MKKIIAIFSALLAVATACQKHYELNTSFTMPTSLSSPSSVVLDVTSTATVELSWTGGGAADGGIVLYEVLFDRAGGNFSEPLTVMPSDLGAGQTLTLSHATLNTIARKAGVAPNQSGSFIWTVRGSRGGVSKVFDGYETLNVTRGEGIDNMPERLYVAGSAAKEAGQEFRVVEEGLYSIVTRLGAGSLRFTSEKGGGLVFHASAAGKLVEGEGDYTVQEAPATGLARITVNFNTLSLKIESVEAQLHAAWEATGVDFAVLEYEGNGVFSGEGEAVFYGPGRDGTPSWCSWVEERYSFLVEIDGVQKRWGSSFGGNSFTPDGTESFYYIYEFDKADWDALWKMDHALDLKNVRVTVWTNKDNQFTHMVEEAGPIVYDQPTSTPAELFLTGAAAETDGQAFRKDGDKFVAYAKLNAGALSFVDGEGVKYFIQNDNDLYIGKRSYDVAASEGVTRVTVDFSTNKVTFDEIGTDVRMIWGCNYETVIALSYQGGGKFAGEGRVVFVDSTRPESYTRGEIVARDQMKDITAYLKRFVPGFENAWVDKVAPFMGIRESREIEAEYMLTGDDIVYSRRFDDVIACAGYPLDIHHSTGGDCTMVFTKDNHDIPYRCLVPKGVKNLLVAGRCSGYTHEAMAATRVMSTCMAVGEAAGRAARIALDEGVEVGKVNVKAVQKELRETGAYLGD